MTLGSSAPHGSYFPASRSRTSRSNSVSPASLRGPRWPSCRRCRSSTGWSRPASSSRPCAVIRLVTTRRSDESRGAGDQAAGFEAVEQAGHVRVAGDHPVADLAAGDALRRRVRVPAVAAAGARAAEDAEHVVLRGRDAVRLEQLGQVAHQHVRGPHHREEGLLLRGPPLAGGGSSGLGLLHDHDGILLVITDIVKRNFLESRTGERLEVLQAVVAPAQGEHVGGPKCKAPVATLLRPAFLICVGTGCSRPVNRSPSRSSRRRSP